MSNNMVLYCLPRPAGTPAQIMDEINHRANHLSFDQLMDVAQALHLPEYTNDALSDNQVAHRVVDYIVSAAETVVKAFTTYSTEIAYHPFEGKTFMFTGGLSNGGYPTALSAAFEVCEYLNIFDGMNELVN